MKYLFNLFVTYCLLFNILKVNASFQSSIFSEVNLDNKGKNVIVSPLSMFQVLGLTTNGAVGETQSEMLSTLQTSNVVNLNSLNLKVIQKVKNFVTVELANGVMSLFNPIKSFVKICDQYEAPIQKLISKEQVNEWCSEKTHGKITEILDELNPATVMLLLNAVYFRGEWVYPFNPDHTFDGTFYTAATDSKNAKKAKFMTQTREFKYYQNKEIQAIELPYKNDSMSAVILLPNKGIDLNNYVNLNNVNDEFINTVLEGMVETTVKINLPKFEVEYYGKLKEVLQRLGMVKAFGDADFSGINGAGGLYIDNVIHKTYLKVDEIGSEAAGVTVVDMRKSLPIPNAVVDVNRPFILIIKSSELPKGNNFLFMAKIEDL